jgi:hypothetical protein
MLLNLLSMPPFEAQRMERLLVLEQQLRQRSYGAYKLADYVGFLEAAEIRLPTRRTLHEDLRRYAVLCDDVEYGEQKKKLSLDGKATRDAVAWLMGQAWVGSPLQPRLSSACVRCLLLAQQQDAEVKLFYKRLPKPGGAWLPEKYVGKVLGWVPGTDGGYMQLQQLPNVVNKNHFERINLNLLRLNKVSFTGNSTIDYPPEPVDPFCQVTISADSDKHLIARLLSQYQGFVEVDDLTLKLLLPESLRLMTHELLAAHLWRTQQGARVVPSEQKVVGCWIRWLS